MTDKPNKNMELWDSVCITPHKYTKAANVRGNKITAIAPQSQIMMATEKFGPYGNKWGFRTMSIDSSLMNVGLVVFKGLFYYPDGEFEIISSIGIYRDGAKTKLDDDFGKKVETDALTKALSKLGFNADIFLGKYDDNRYVQDRIDDDLKEENESSPPEDAVTLDLPATNDGPGWQPWIAIFETKINACRDVGHVNKWMELNQSAIDNLTAASPKHGKYITDHADNKRGMLFQAPE